MRLSVLFLVPASCVASRVSGFAGSTSTAILPPPSAGTASPNDPEFPNASHVGNAVATPTGDEANAIATACAKVKTYGPLVKPRPLNKGQGSFDVLQHLGNLSPSRSVDSFGLLDSDELIPDRCKLNQVHLLHRHGARYPNGQGKGSPAAFASTLHAAASSGKLKVSSRLRFLRDWTFKLGEDGLTPFGRQEMLDLGVATTSQARMVDSALNFVAGFFGVQNYLQDYHQLIMIEASNFKNTLASGAVCPNANNAIGNFGRAQNVKWANVYLRPALKRLSQSIRGLDLTISYLVGMQMTCAYETVALGYPSFCRMFNEKEWEGFAYWNDPLFWDSFDSVESTHIRWILNDAVVPLTGIQGCHTNQDGLCPLPAFFSGLQQRLAEIDYKFDCFANYAIPDPDLITDGKISSGSPKERLGLQRNVYIVTSANTLFNIHGIAKPRFAAGGGDTINSNSFYMNQKRMKRRTNVHRGVSSMSNRGKRERKYPRIPYKKNAACTILASHASTFAGSTSTTVFPPPGVTLTPNDPNFPPHPGGVPVAGEAEVIATAPHAPKVDLYSPLVEPRPLGGSGGAFDLLQHLGALSPFKSVDSFGLRPERKDSKWVQTKAGTPGAFATKLHAAASSGNLTVRAPLGFLKDWVYKLGRNDLTPLWTPRNVLASVSNTESYLIASRNSLSLEPQHLDAWWILRDLHFAAGFFGVQTFQQDYHQLIIPESAGMNNTLAAGEVCPNANNDIAAFGILQSLKWANIYFQPTLKRLQKSIDGLELDVFDLVAMQMACAYETVALGFSAFCNAFTEGDWRGYAYLNDVSVWYGSGPGNPSVAALGVGYVQELVSRLTRTRITESSSSVNATLARSEITFPFNQPIYVDSTHDLGLSAIFTAMNFTSLAAQGPLPTDHIPDNQSFFVQKQVPFGARLVGQVLSCNAQSEDTPSHIRWILNDGVLPLTGISGCTKSKDGLCELSAFVQGLQQQIAEIDFAFDCFANYTIPDPDPIVDGRFPPALRTSVP
ncbi:phosphoglycerate mutase-like protein [Pleurotus eryngii]|uniref:Phosphoglycerate mutase-like protein n=1 Tax=Pleurotus eryngii TaxID=5323 RepID=A0A9P5ZY20_PLEER|nr:phosphoglycerate mutase-like protein [Pleurotus eryngii]